jgi:hypothetical protein
MKSLGRIIRKDYRSYRWITCKKYNLRLLAEQRVNESIFPALYFDCGTDDQYLYESNLWFKEKLEKIKYPFQSILIQVDTTGGIGKST